MADPKRIWNEVRRLLGLSPIQERVAGPPDWWLEMDKNPLVPLGPQETTDILSAMDRASVDPTIPGTKAMDFIPRQNRSEAYHQEAAKHWSDRGYTYRRNESSVKKSDIPKGTKILPYRGGQ